VRLFNALARGPLPGVARALDLLARSRRLNRRMHNKMLAVDGIAGIVGGRNVGDAYFDADPRVNFADMDLLAVGPVIGDLGSSFDAYWNSEFASPVAGWRRLRAGEPELVGLREELREHEIAARDSPYAERARQSHLYERVRSGDLDLTWATLRVIADPPEKIDVKGDVTEEDLLSRQLVRLFENADSELLVVSPYFIPRERGVEFLARAEERGVRTRVLTSSLEATDVGLVHSAYARYRRPLLEGGVELFEMKRSGAAVQEAQARGAFGSSSASLHAKTYVFDRRELFIGSANLDPRSLDLNTEIGFVVESRELAGRQAARFDEIADAEMTWRLSLEASGELVWSGTDGGQPERYTRDPGAGFWTRAKLWLAGLLPLEDQL